MSNPNKVAILILAAGESTRMGEPKQLLPWKNTTLLGHAITEAKLVCSENIFVVLGGHYNKIKQVEELKSTTVLYNADYKLGQGASLAYGIKQLLQNNIKYRAVLIMLCDQPLITAKYLRKMLIEFCESSKEIAATDYQNRAGVPAIFDKKYFNELSEITGDKGAKDILRKHSKDVIVVAANSITLDVDTKIVYENLKNENRF